MGCRLRGLALDAVAAWKEALLVLALAAAFWSARRLPLVRAADRLAVVYTAFVVLYAVLPPHWLDGTATAKGVLYALRHDLIPVGAYALGRLAAVSGRRTVRSRVACGRRGLGAVRLGVRRRLPRPAPVVARLGCTWLVPAAALARLRSGLSHLPENWVYNTGDENHPLRRLVSTFLSPLATAYLLVVALLFIASRERLGPLG